MAILKLSPLKSSIFGGGANGIRAWRVRTLGPGSFNPCTTGFLNLTADIKMEANAEYRFKLFWILEGAVFFLKLEISGLITMILHDPGHSSC